KGHAVSCRQRADVHDAPAAGGTHGRHDSLAAVPDAFDVDGHRGIPIGFGQRVEAAAAQGAIERSIIHQTIDAAKSVGSSFAHCGSGSGVSNVEFNGDGVAASVLDQIDSRSAVVNVSSHDSRAGGSEATGVLLPDAARRAGDDDHFVFDAHDFSKICSRTESFRETGTKYFALAESLGHIQPNHLQFGVVLKRVHAK